jgi:hypothetical protein
LLQFHASVVEVLGTAGDEFEPLTVHFDDGRDHYLQLQEIPDRATDPRSARVYVEVNDQGNAGGDCLELAELGRGQFRVVFTGEPSLQSYGEVIVTFDLNDQSYVGICEALRNIFAGSEAFRITTGSARTRRHT